MVPFLIDKLAASESIKSIVDGLSQVSAATPSQMAELKESLQALKLKLEVWLIFVSDGYSTNLYIFFKK